MKNTYSKIVKSWSWIVLVTAILWSPDIFASGAGTQSSSHPNYIYVNQYSYGSSGTSWSDAFSDLQMALDIAKSGDSIFVASGTYIPTKDTLGGNALALSKPRTATFFIPAGVSVIGGFDASIQYHPEWDMWEHRDVFEYTTKLSGEIGSSAKTDNVYTVVILNDSVVLNGFNITDGYADSSNLFGYAGGVMIYKKKNITISNCFFENNYGDQSGAVAIYWTFNNSIKIKRCVFLNDSTDSGGGAIGLWNSHAEISNCAFILNAANQFGSAIYNWGSGSTSNIVNCDFYGNKAYNSTDNGAIHSRGVTSTVANCIFWQNMGNDVDGSNGGGSTLTYSNIQQSGYSGNGNISGDPKFVNPANFDFNLAANSPCIDAANGTVAPTYDFDKKMRVDIPGHTNTGTGTPSYVDMGVVEYSQDIEMVDWAGINSFCDTSSTMTVAYKLTNLSTDTLYNVPVKFIYDNGTAVTEYISVFPNNDTITHIFSTGINAKTPGYHRLRMFSDYSGDANKKNDSLIFYWKAVAPISTFPWTEDFEDHTLNDFTWELVNKYREVYMGIDSLIGVNDSWGLEIHGSPTYNSPWNYPTEVESAFQNGNYRMELFNCSIDASSKSNLAFAFDFKQSKSWNTFNCVFRVMINDSIYAKTFDGDSVWTVPQYQSEVEYQNLMFDLTPYIGSSFKLSLEAITYVYQPGYDEDFIRIDNMKLWERPAIDVGITTIESTGDSDCGVVQDSLYAIVKNYGIDTVNNIPVSGVIIAPDGTHNYNVSSTGSLAPLNDTILYLGTLNTTLFGNYDVRLATALTGDGNIINDSLTGVFINYRYNVPELEDFDGDFDWDYNGFSPVVIQNTAKAMRADVNGGNLEGYYYSSFYLRSSSPFGIISNKSILVFDYYLSNNLGSDTLNVLVSDDCKSTWNIVGTYTAQNLLIGGYFHRLSISLASWSGQNVFLKLELNGSHSSSYQFYVDNFGVLNSINFDLGNDTTICGGSGAYVLSTGLPSTYNHEWTKLGSPGVLSTDSFFTVNSTGIYVARVSDNFGTEFFDTISITVLPKPTANFTQSSMDICAGGTANFWIYFKGTAPFIFSLKENNTTLIDTAYNNFISYSKTFNDTTIVIINTLSDNSGCVYVENFDTLTINTNPLPVVSLGGLAAGYCSNELAVTPTISPSGGILSGTGVIGNDFYPAFAASGANNIVYSYTDSNGCVNSDTASVTVYLASVADISTSLNTSYCQNNDTVHLSGAPAGGIFSGPGVTGNVFDPSQATPGSVDIVYSYTDSNDCVDRDTAHISVYALPTVTFSPLGSSCANGNPITLSGGTPSGGFFSGPGVIQGIFYPNLAPPGSDTLIYGYTDIHGCSNSAAQAITVTPVPLASISMPATVCTGDTANISFTGTATASTYWDFDGGQILSGSGNGPYGISWSSAGAKTIKLVASENACSSDTAISFINVLSTYAHITAVGNTTVCHGDSVVLFANIGPGYSYQWYDTSGILSNDTLSYYIASQTGTYYVELTNPNACSAISNSIGVVVQPLVTADFTLPGSACQGDTVSVSYTGNSGSSAAFNWSFDGATIASGSGQGPYLLLWNTDSIKTVSLSVVDNGCFSQPVDKSISILSEKAQITPLGNTSFCNGDSIVLYANAGTYSYDWKKNGVSLGVTTPLYTASTSGNYSVAITNTTTGCSDESDSLVVIANSTNFGLAFTASPTSFTGTPFNTSISNQTANTSDYYWQWDFGDGNTSNLVSPNHQYLYDGTYTVSLFAQNINTGCRDTLVKTDYITCTGGNPNPCTLVAAISPSGSAIICPGDTVQLKATYNAGASYQWLKDGLLISGATDSSYNATLPGMYQVMVSDNVCSQFSQAFALSNYPVITPSIVAIGSIMPCTDDSMELHVPTYFNNYFWNNGDTTQSIYIKSSGNYQVTTTDANGCKTTSQPYVVNASLLQIPEICIVGVDSATNHNMIIWERQANDLIDSFRIYRESVVAGVYTLIGTRPANSPGIFMDNASNPLQRAYRYKLTAVDTCGQETPPSDYHQTIHLNVNAGMNGTWNLIWEGYKGFNFGSYRIYRGTDSTQMQLLTQIQSTLSSYTDLNPPPGDVYYQIEVESPHPCYPDSIYAKSKINYSSSRSNWVNTKMASNTGMGLQVQNELWMNIYPNPNKGMFTLAIKHPGKVSGRLTIINNIGEIVYSEELKFNGKIEKNLDLKYLSKGFYIIRIQTDMELITGKMVIQ